MWPITTPLPPRPGIRPASLTMHAYSTSRSPAGPMLDTACLGVADFGQQDVLYGVGIHAPQVRRIPQFGMSVHDTEIDRRFGCALEDQAIVPGQLEVAAPKSARAGIAQDAGERRLEDNLEPARAAQRRPRHRAGHDQ